MTDDFTKNKILFVPGKNPKPLPDAHRALLWRCLLRGVQLIDPAIDFVSLARSFGIAAERAKTVREATDLLGKALKDNVAMLIDVVLDRGFKPM